MMLWKCLRGNIGIKRSVIHQIAFRMYYAVRVGKNPGLYETWEECSAQVVGFRGAQFKKFDTREDAISFIEVNKLSEIRKKCSGESLPTSNGSRLSKRPKLEKDANGVPGKWTVSKLCTTFSGSDLPSPFPDRPVVYTDGSCFNNGKEGASGGIGVFWAPEHPRNRSIELTGVQTNQRAEILAVIEALKTALDMNLHTIEVRTDSQYVINCMSIWADKWLEKGWQNVTLTNKDDLLELASLCQSIDVNLVHVPGHKSIYGNVEADKLARSASTRNAVKLKHSSEAS